MGIKFRIHPVAQDPREGRLELERGIPEVKGNEMPYVYHLLHSSLARIHEKRPENVSSTANSEQASVWGFIIETGAAAVSGFFSL